VGPATRGTSKLGMRQVGRKRDSATGGRKLVRTVTCTCTIEQPRTREAAGEVVMFQRQKEPVATRGRSRAWRPERERRRGADHRVCGAEAVRISRMQAVEVLRRRSGGRRVRHRRRGGRPGIIELSGVVPTHDVGAARGAAAARAAGVSARSSAGSRSARSRSGWRTTASGSPGASHPRASGGGTACASARAAPAVAGDRAGASGRFGAAADAELEVGPGAEGVGVQATSVRAAG
jgi:hypothetical protein